MSKTDEVRKAMVEAMKAKDKDTKDTLSLLLSALKNKAIDKRAELTEEEEIQVVLKEIKQTKETMELVFHELGYEDCPQRYFMGGICVDGKLPDEIRSLL